MDFEKTSRNDLQSRRNRQRCGALDSGLPALDWPLSALRTAGRPASARRSRVASSPESSARPLEPAGRRRDTHARVQRRHVAPADMKQEDAVVRGHIGQTGLADSFDGQLCRRAREIRLGQAAQPLDAGHLDRSEAGQLPTVQPSNSPTGFIRVAPLGRGRKRLIGRSSRTRSCRFRRSQRRESASQPSSGWRTSGRRSARWRCPKRRSGFRPHSVRPG